MGKSKHLGRDKEHSRLQKLIRENENLKKKLSSLRKQLQRIDLDRYENIKDVIEKYDKIEKEKEEIENSEFLKKKWRCKECSSGHLEIVLFSKLSEDWYYRQCTQCEYRTRAQRFNEKVSGIFKQGAKSEIV